MSVEKSLNKMRKKESFVDDLFFLLDFIDGVVPSQFYKILEMAKVLDVLTDGDFVLRQNGMDVVNVVESIVSGSTLGYDLSPDILKAKSINDIGKLSVGEIVEAGGVIGVLRSYVRGKLKINDLVLDSEDNANIAVETDNKYLNNDEQELYFLLDLSYSMKFKSRLLLAQTLMLWYLGEKFVRNNARPRLYLRGFADKVSDLVRCESVNDLPLFISEILNADASNVGTELQDAILVAVNDIAFFNPVRSNAGVELLIVTDGLVKLDENVIKKVLNEYNVKLNVVLIGATKVLPSRKEELDLIERLNVINYDIPTSEQREDLAYDMYDAMYKKVWFDIAWNLIEIGDVDFLGIDFFDIEFLHFYLNENVFNIMFNEASEFVIKRVVYIYDVLVQMIIDCDDKNKCSELVVVKNNVAEWLIDGFEFTLDGLTSRKPKNSVDNAKLKIGMNKVTMTFVFINKLGDSPKVFVNLTKLLARYVFMMFISVYNKIVDIFK